MIMVQKTEDSRLNGRLSFCYTSRILAFSFGHYPMSTRSAPDEHPMRVGRKIGITTTMEWGKY